MIGAILDVHVHAALDAEKGSFGSVDDVLRKMDVNGIDQAVLSPWPAYETPDGVRSTARQNDALRATLDAHPDRFPVGLGVAEPRHGERASAEARRAVQDLGLSGLAFDSDVNGIAIDGDPVRVILDAVVETPGVVVAFSTMAYSVLRSSFRLGIVARRFPTLQFISLNAFMDITHEVASYDLAERCENIWFDLGCAKTQLSTVERAVEAIGPDRVLFGSAIPDVERSHHLEMVRIAEVSDDVRAAILGGNARRLFQLEEVAA
jgi:predicted TIM-barrel fold metal-dependent hydrolase